MQAIHPSRSLKLALVADAVVSGAVAMLQLLAVQGLAGLLSLPYALLWETGLFLGAYVVLLLVLARGRRVWSALIGLVVAGNAGWAIGCVALLAAGLVEPSGLGTGYLLLQAVTVLVFAAWQFIGWRASSAAARPGLAAA